MKLTKSQRKFLKTIENPKDKKHQKQQFKLQNKFDKFGLVEEIIFIDGIFKTDNPELIAFLNECPTVGKVGESNATKSTWFEEISKESENKFMEQMKIFCPANFEENSLTKETLRDLTEPKAEQIEEESLPDFIKKCEHRLLQDLDHGTCVYMYEKCLRRQQYVLASKFGLKQIEILSKFDDEKLKSFLQQGFINLLTMLKAKRLKLQNTTKNDNQDVTTEFCVEITEENKEVLQKIFSDYHKGRASNLVSGRLLHSNSLFTQCFESNSLAKNLPVVSTEEFFRYIGKEELIKDYQFFKECTNISKMYSPKLLEELVEFSEKACKQKPLEFDLPKKENPIQDIECLSINEVIYSGVLMLDSPLCKNLKNYLIDIVGKKTNPLNL